ncbi:exosortase/archaeosortase family protein [Curtobacterium sp. 9128]|nr:exosortase/archaeosortase family protein [Curtobacterium sp. 9128]
MVTGRSVGARSARVLVAALLVVLAVTLIIGERVGRAIEASTAAWLVGTVTGMDVLPADASTVPAVVFRSGDLQWNVLEITLECAIAFLLAGLLVMGAALVSVARFSLVRVLLAIGVGASLLVAVNQLRIVMLSLVLAHGGINAFEWAHSFAGSVVSLAGLTLTLLVVFVLVVRPGSRASTRNIPTREEFPA